MQISEIAAGASVAGCDELGRMGLVDEPGGREGRVCCEAKRRLAKIEGGVR